MILQRGHKGELVERVQLRLVELGYLDEKIRQTGVGMFGPATEAAIVKWEQEFYVSGSLDDAELAELLPNEPRKNDDDIPHGQDALEVLYGRPWEEADWWKRWGAPAEIGSYFSHIVKRGRIWVNRDIVSDVESIFKQIADEGLAQAVHTYDGCFCVRRVRAHANVWSTHTWAVAIDLNAATNGLGVQGDMAPSIIRIFKEHSWVCGADFKRKDYMHFQRVTGM